MILDRILAQKSQEVDALYRQASLGAWRERAQSCAAPIRDMRRVLLRRQLPAIIAEVKKASPSKGVLRQDFHPVAIAKDYEACGAAAVSVLTDERFFQSIPGSLAQVRERVSLPILRKDFIIDAVQVYESRIMGADCILLIAAALGRGRLGQLQAEAERLGMQCLVEVHNQVELEAALDCGSQIIGINNRDLQTFSTSLDVTERLLASMPDDVTVVSESGIASHADMQRLAGLGVDAVLIGESFMRAPSIRSQFAHLRGLTPRKEVSQAKICGLQTVADAAAVNQSGADYAGFVFAPSRRQVTPAQAAAVGDGLAASVRRVGVFVNQPQDYICSVVRECGLQVVQLHGDEDPVYCRELRSMLADRRGTTTSPTIWKVVAVGAPGTETGSAYYGLPAYLPYVDGIVMDSWHPKLRGGSGQAFSWDRAQPLAASLPDDVLWVLAGGLNEDNVGLALQTLRPSVVDVSSGVETDGAKDAHKIERFAAKVREFNESECQRETDDAGF